MILFRADGNEIVGSGHIMRCLSIAQAAKDLGEECCFVMADKSFASAVEHAGVQSFFLNTDFKSMPEELNQLLPVIEKVNPQCIVVDSYYVTEKYLQKIRQYSPVVYIDDLASFAYPVDVLINYNIYGEKIGYVQMYQEQNRKLPKLLLGPSYAPLRKEFKEVKRKPQPKKIKNILVSTGGADHEHVALKLAKYLTTHERKSAYQYHFLLGAMNPDVLELTRIEKEFSEIIKLHQNVRQMRELLQSCDIAVSAAGSTLYELCACGIPTITYVLADNQILGACTFEEKGLMLYVGDCRKEKDFPKHAIQAIETLVRKYLYRENVAEQMYMTVTGNGAKKIIEYILRKHPLTENNLKPTD